MTMWAQRDDNGKHIEVRIRYGPISINVQEDPGHLRSFWGELGHLLDKIERDNRPAGS